MKYKKTIWKARKGTNKNRFEKEQETARSVILSNAPTSIEEPGTPFSPENMNNIENGIEAAHELIAAEEQARQEADTGLLQAIAGEAQTRAAEDQTLQQNIENEAQARQQAVNIEAAARIQGDKDTLEAANEYTRQTVLAGNEMLPPVMTIANLPTTGLLNTRNYLCKVVADPVQSGVYQAIAGWTSIPAWVLYDDNVDFVVEEELAAAVGEHDADVNAHTSMQVTIPASSTKTEFGTSSITDTLSNIFLKIRQGFNWLKSQFIPLNQKGASNGVAPLVNGKLPTENMPSVQVTINRTISLNDNSTDTSVSDTGGALTIPLAVQSLTTPSASSTQLTAGTKALRDAVQTVANNIAYLFVNKANLASPTFTGTPQIQFNLGTGIGNITDRIAVVTSKSETSANQHALPVGSYIVAEFKGVTTYYKITNNYIVSVYLYSGNSGYYIQNDGTTSSDQQMLGSWRACGVLNYNNFTLGLILLRRVS